MCCTLKVRDVLHIKNVSSPLSSFAHQLTFPLATHRHRRRSLFWPSTRQKTTITKNVNWKSRFPKIPSKLSTITFFSFHCTVSLLVEEACCVLLEVWTLLGTVPSLPGTILILWLGRVVNPTEWNWYCTIWKVWPIVPDHCEHWKQSLAWLVSFFLSCDWLFCNQLRRNRLNVIPLSWLLVPKTD